MRSSEGCQIIFTGDILSTLDFKMAFCASVWKIHRQLRVNILSFILESVIDKSPNVDNVMSCKHIHIHCDNPLTINETTYIYIV